MSRSFRRRFLVLGFTLGACVAAAVTALLISPGDSHSVAHASVAKGAIANRSGDVAGGTTVITIDRAAASRAIAPGFLGLSLEFPAIVPYAGSDPHAVDPVLVQLIRNLAPGQAPVLRIGGDSTDLTWWRVAHVSRPPGANYTLTPKAVAVAGALVRVLGARAILGINLEAGSTVVAAAEARALLTGVGRDQVEALELGNEPELYGSFIWDGSGRTGRPRGYGFAAYRRDIARMLGAMPKIPLAAPATGAVRWFRDIGKLLATERHLGVVTLHRYPLQRCYVSPSAPTYPTIANLLSPTASRGQADSVAGDVRIAHGRGVPLRIDEMNTNSCGSSPAVSESFASALWILDALFQMARVGVDGVNIHSYPRATYELFTFTHGHGRWRAFVEPEYYGMLMFAQAAPAQSRLLRLSLRPRPRDRLEAWATLAPDGKLRVVVINAGKRRQTVVVRVRGIAGASTLERLTAPSIAANHDVMLGGQGFGSETETGLLAGRPHPVSVAPAAGKYALRLPAASAALLTISSS